MRKSEMHRRSTLTSFDDGFDSFDGASLNFHSASSPMLGGRLRASTGSVQPLISVPRDVNRSIGKTPRNCTRAKLPHACGPGQLITYLAGAMT